MIEGHSMTLTIFCQSSYVPYSSSYDVFQWNLFIYIKKRASSKMYNCIILHDTAQMWPSLGGIPGPALKKKRKKRLNFSTLPRTHTVISPSTWSGTSGRNKYPEVLSLVLAPK